MYDIEEMKYWPQWMNCMTQPLSGSLFAQVCVYPGIREYAILSCILDSREIPYAYTKQPYYEWRCWVQSENLYSINEITFYCPAVSGMARRALNPHDFEYEVTPVFFVDGGVIRFRNLDVIQVTTTPPSGYFAPAEEDAVPDTQSWYRQTIEWEPLNKPFYIPECVEADFIYHDVTYYESISTSGFVQIGTLPPVRIIRFPVKNIWDDIALTAQLTRKKDETNTSLRNRIIAKFSTLRAPTQNRTAFAITTELGNIAGPYTLSKQSVEIPAASGVTYVYTAELPRVTTRTDTPYALGYNAFRLPRSIEGGLCTVFHNGKPIPITWTGSGDFTTEEDVSTVAAVYRVKNYAFTKQGEYITEIRPSEDGGTIDGKTVWGVRGLTIENLTTSISDLTTAEIIETTETIRRKSLSILGYGRWDTLYWFGQNDIKPEVSFVLNELE